jgi:GNAT superfamily N-acetyltransferase
VPRHADTVTPVALEIRTLTADDDLAAIGRIVLDAYHELPGRPADASYDAELADVAERVARATVFGAFDRGVGVGCVTYVADETATYAENLAPGEASFRMLAVAPHAQGRGVGDALVRRCIDEATSAGREALFIYSGAWMPAAHRLYERLGFSRRAGRDWVFEDLGIHLFGFWRPL